MARRTGSGEWLEAGREAPMRRLRGELAGSSATARPSQEYCHGQVAEEDSVSKASQGLLRDLDAVKISLQNKTLALQRTQLVSALKNQLKENNNESREIMRTLNSVIMRSRALTACHQEVYEKEQKLIDLRKKRFLLKQTGEQKQLQLPHLMKKEEEQESTIVSRGVKKLHDNLQKERELTAIIQTVFQIILLASNVNWAEDPSLKEVVLKLEKNAYLL
ncbi:centromere protein H [Cuculus canorus]|uniref:centromere protein H n=1 Tax=Cuculus canorus TaxID=55661 RepID=UPI0023AA82BB|nr:centromere protein H [Cuculus canorus]